MMGPVVVMTTEARVCYTNDVNDIITVQIARYKGGIDIYPEGTGTLQRSWGLTNAYVQIMTTYSYRCCKRYISLLYPGFSEGSYLSETSRQ